MYGRFLPESLPRAIHKTDNRKHLAMQTALEGLGYSAYHMSSAFRNENHFNLWNEAIQAKHNSKGIPYGRTDFDKLLKKYDAITDVPAVLFSEELLKAYPNTKVILTTRNPDKWLKSMDQTILRAISWPSWRYLSRFDNKMIGPFCRNQILTLKIWTGGDIFNRVKLRQGFVDHYANIRAIVPKENLLEHEPLDGYEPLCRFLGKETPAVDTGYPNINDASHLVAMMRYFWFMLLWKAVKRSLFLASPWLVLAAAVYNMDSFISTVSRRELVHL
jgi:hypothetical protein